MMMTTILTKPNLHLANVQIAAGIIRDAIHAAPRTKINILSFFALSFSLCLVQEKWWEGSTDGVSSLVSKAIMSGRIEISGSELKLYQNSYLL